MVYVDGYVIPFPKAGSEPDSTGMDVNTVSFDGKRMVSGGPRMPVGS
jgi:uncharacterized protein YbaA (DUF1428 family)